MACHEEMSESATVAVNYFIPSQITAGTKAVHRLFPTLRTKCANVSYCVSPDKERTQDK
jgi:hypothetical protein